MELYSIPVGDRNRDTAGSNRQAARSSPKEFAECMMSLTTLLLQLLRLVSTGTTGFGSVTPAAQVFAVNELQPLQTRSLQLNEWIGQQAVTFDGYKVAGLPVNGMVATS